MKMKKNNNLFYQNRYFIFFLLYSVFYHVVIVNRLLLEHWEGVDRSLYAIFAVDFSFGFASKLLPGAVFRALFGTHASPDNAAIFMIVIVVLVFFGVAFLLQKWIKCMPQNEKSTALFLCVLYLSGAYTFAIFTKTIPLFDTFWVLFTLVFYLVLENKILRWIIPVLFILCIFVHTGALLNYIVLMSVVLLYRLSIEIETKQRRTYIAILILSVVGAAVTFLFFTLFETKMICSFDEFHKKLVSNGCNDFYYYDYAFFDIYVGNSYIPTFVNDINSPIVKLFYVIYYRIKLNIHVIDLSAKTHLLSFCCALFMLLPIVVQFLIFHNRRRKRIKNKLQRLCSSFMVVQFPLVLMAELLFSEDITRQFTHSFLIAFTLVLTVLYYEREQAAEFFESVHKMASQNSFKIYTVAYCIWNILLVY